MVPRCIYIVENDTKSTPDDWTSSKTAPIPASHSQDLEHGKGGDGDDGADVHVEGTSGIGVNRVGLSGLGVRAGHVGGLGRTVAVPVVAMGLAVDGLGGRRARVDGGLFVVVGVIMVSVRLFSVSLLNRSHFGGRLFDDRRLLGGGSGVLGGTGAFAVPKSIKLTHGFPFRWDS